MSGFYSGFNLEPYNDVYDSGSSGTPVHGTPAPGAPRGSPFAGTPVSLPAIYPAVGYPPVHPGVGYPPVHVVGFPAGSATHPSGGLPPPSLVPPAHGPPPAGPHPTGLLPAPALVPPTPPHPGATAPLGGRGSVFRTTAPTVTLEGRYSARPSDTGTVPTNFPIVVPQDGTVRVVLPRSMQHLRGRTRRFTMICTADGQLRDFITLDGVSPQVTALFLDKLRNYHSSTNQSNPQELISHLLRLNYGRKGVQYKVWIRMMDRLCPALMCAKLALGDCSFLFHRKIKKLSDLNISNGTITQKLIYDRALIVAYNCHMCYNAHGSADQLTVDDIMSYDVYCALHRLRTVLKLHGVFSYDYLEATFGNQVRASDIKGLPYALFLLLDSFIPYNEWRAHLTDSKTLVTPREKQLMNTNVLFHRL